MSSLLSKVKLIEPKIIELRRKLHEFPELSNQEFESQKLIISELEKMNIDYQKVGTTSIIATIKGHKPKKIVALRADFDALPIVEETDVSFKSQNEGIMHACGHDGHTAMLLGAAKILSEMSDQFDGEVRLFFQEGEENLTGAKKIIEAGGLDNVDACFGMHGNVDLEVGEISFEAGYRMAGSDLIEVTFHGVSGHGSTPHLAKDTIMAASNFVLNLQAIVTKNVSAQEVVVLSVGRFEGGTQANIIAKTTQLEISMRYFTEEVRQIVHQGILRHAHSIAEAYEISVDVNLKSGAPSLYNDESIVESANESALKIFKANRQLSPSIASDDMAYYLQQTKGVYAFIGYRNADKGAIYPPHHDKFTIDEDYLKYGTAMHVQFVLDFLNQD